MLHILPAFGDVNHGFYNVHPIVYSCLANANAYEMVDFQYITDVHGRTETLNRDLAATLDFISPAPRDVRASGAVDYCYVALRKILDAPFQYPQQD
jgi:elongation factor P hydroxylase